MKSDSNVVPYDPIDHQRTVDLVFAHVGMDSARRADFS